MWITNSWEAEFFLVFANVDPSKGYKGITCFIVPRELGVKVAKKEEKLGIRASSTCTLNFDDVKVPAENVLGGVGKGYKIAIEILNEGRIGIAAQMLGLAQGAFDKVAPYTYERKQFGQPIATFQGMQHQMAKAALDIETARLLTYNAARRKEEGREFTKEAAMAKYWASQVAMSVSGSAIEWAGGIGFTRETGIEKFWRDSKIVSGLSYVHGGMGLISRNRARSTRAHRISNYRRLPSSFRSSIHETDSLRADGCTRVVGISITSIKHIELYAMHPTSSRGKQWYVLWRTDLGRERNPLPPLALACYLLRLVSLHPATGYWVLCVPLAVGSTTKHCGYLLRSFTTAATTSHQQPDGRKELL